MFWAACCLGFSAFLRSGEFTVKSARAFDPDWDMSPNDIAVDSIETPKRMYVRIKGSKTDQLRQGVTLVVGRTGNKLCPICSDVAILSGQGQGRGPVVQVEGQETN